MFAFLFPRQSTNTGDDNDKFSTRPMPHISQPRAIRTSLRRSSTTHSGKTARHSTSPLRTNSPATSSTPTTQRNHESRPSQMHSVATPELPQRAAFSFSNTRAGPSNIAWIVGDNVFDVQNRPVTISRSASLPIAPRKSVWKKKSWSARRDALRNTGNLHTRFAAGSENAQTAWRSTYSLQDFDSTSRSDTAALVLHGNSAARPLSAIEEQEYFTPTGRGTIALPPLSWSCSDAPPEYYSQTHSGSVLQENQTPTLPQYPQPLKIHQTTSQSQSFIFRHVNRSISQRSGASSIGIGPPTIPPINTGPNFPGPHPSSLGHIRPRKTTMGTIGTVPTIPTPQTPDDHDYYHSRAMDANSEHEPREYDFDSRYLDLEEGSVYGGESDEEYYAAVDHHTSGSLHADSFITATEPVTDSPEPAVAMPLPYQIGNIPSASSSLFDRRVTANIILDSAAPGIEPTQAPSVKRKRVITPACWAFFFGFLCPPFWLFGGWYFTPLYLESYSGSSHPRDEERWSGWWGSASVKAENFKESSILSRWVLDLEKNPRNLTDNETSSQLQQRTIRQAYPFIAAPSEKVVSADVHQGLFHVLSQISWFRIDIPSPPSGVESDGRILDPYIWRCRCAAPLGCLVLLAVFLVVSIVFLY